MKRILLWLTIALVALMLAIAPGAARKVRVVATTNDLKWAVEQIGGKNVEVVALMHPLQNPHTVQPRPSFIVHLNRADLLVRIGLDYEEIWLPPLVEESRNPKIRRGGVGDVDVSIGIPLLEIPQGRVTREQGEVHIFGNPHYWLDPENMKIIARNIAEGLKRVDPSNANEYDRNLKRLERLMDDLLDETLKLAATLRGEKFVAYHTTWSYLANRYGFRIIGYLEPKPGIPPSASHLADLIVRMRQEKVKVIIKEPFYENRIPNMVAQRTGAKVVEICPTIGGESGTETYPKLIRHILTKLVNAVQSVK
ncbi:metal ABC transporter substrate-binding protein [Fervidibacter sacchari]|uniref:Zinc/manganese transport system substrate-binding protein n=1 Tax=Candidatus Fervidibacter sacchari TaxID=1448929 RepID=A0ABT2EP28_9BACT|nr:metal ABC transporter substrate-binding protein [Candidatus Fervidibacter sacchari]MCS3919605.1 zinc/manganese transport system substrate-binding protein [Candidatus Fervidibacter sacchari]WKU15325.1 metal ABC transporter substrate-binding protein [Candidatus Fervidibacter sacchari]